MKAKQIVVVEDERIVAMDIKNTLEGLGYEVLSIMTRGEEIVDRAAELMPDLILMDIMLEGDMDGVDAARIVKDRIDIPVIFLSAYSDEVTIQRAKISEPYGYVLKPFNGKDLHTAIEMALYKHQMESKLKKFERWLATTLKSIGDAVISTDIGRSVILMNTAAEVLTGWTQEDVLGRDLLSLMKFVDEHTGEYINDPVQQVLAGGTFEHNREALLLNRQGAKIPVTMGISPITNNAGIITGVVFVLRVIKLQKAAELVKKKTHTKLRHSMNAIIDAMAYAVEARDPYTAGHQRRVTNLARTIAEEMGLGEDQIDGIRMAGVIHDLGKISVPAEILSKPGRLSNLEFQIIKTHSQTGYEILKNIDFPWPVASIVLQHHEKMDGSGYPMGLKGDDIFIEARIITVADVVEAMASHRPYRPALGIEISLDEISKNRGVLYDNDAVGACLKVFEKGFQFL